MAEPRERHESDEREGGERRPEPPVRAPQRDQDTEQEEEIAEHLQREAREEVRERPDVAVRALDHLAGGVRVVEGEVEAEAVRDEVGAQGGRGRPAEILGHGGRGEPQQIGGDRRAEVAGRGTDRVRGAGTSQGRIDAGPQELGGDELEAEARAEQDGQEEHARGVRAEIACQDGAIALARHRAILSQSPRQSPSTARHARTQHVRMRTGHLRSTSAVDRSRTRDGPGPPCRDVYIAGFGI